MAPWSLEQRRSKPWLNAYGVSSKKLRRDARPHSHRPPKSDLRAQERIAIDYGDAAELADRAAKALKALAANNAGMWKALRAQGVFRGHGPAPKVAFLYTGQGSQYVNMLQQLRTVEPIVADTFAAADRAMTPLLGKPLTDLHLRRRRRPCRLRQGGRQLAADGNHAACRAGYRRGPHWAARGIRHYAGHGRWGTVSASMAR